MATKVETKSFVQSKTLIGAFVLLATFVLKEVNVPVLDEEIQPVIEALLILAGFGLVLVGRLKAEKRLTL